MKKFIAAAAALGLMSAVNVYAGSTTTAFVVPTDEISVGDTFQVELDVTENTGFTSFDAFLEYDPSVIRLEGVGDAPDDIMYYTQSNIPRVFISEEIINAQAAYKPVSGDSDYQGKANGSLSASEIGRIKLSSLVMAADENNMLKKQEGTGTLFTLKFKAVGGGSTALKLTSTSFTTITPAERWTGDTSVSISVAGDPAVTTSAVVATETPTETTTARTGSGLGNNTTATTTAAEETTIAATTEAATETTTESATETTTSAVITEPASGFNDIANYAWAEDYINSLAAKGIVNGYSDGSFKPGDNVKRCDFVVMLARALDLNGSGEDNFSDVPSDAYYADAVAAAKAAGIVNGNGDGTFSPTSFITRQDMMLMAKGALEYKDVQTEADVSVLDKFDDNAEISGYAREGVAAMVSAGVVSGTGSNVEPKGNTTRAQAAVIISKILEKI